MHGGALTGAIFQFDIRIDTASQRASVIDVIKKICNCNPAHAGEKLSRLGKDFTDRCAYIKINGRGCLAAAEYRKRYQGQKPQQQMKQVNGGLHPVNVYGEKDREWVEHIVKNYIANIPQTKPATKGKRKAKNVEIE